MVDSQFLNNLKWFGQTGKDLMNGETIEFVYYMKIENSNPKVAKIASSAAEVCVNLLLPWFTTKRVK